MTKGRFSKGLKAKRKLAGAKRRSEHPKLTVTQARERLARVGLSIRRAPHDYGWLVYKKGDKDWGRNAIYGESPGEAVFRGLKLGKRKTRKTRKTRKK